MKKFLLLCTIIMCMSVICSAQHNPKPSQQKKPRYVVKFKYLRALRESIKPFVMSHNKLRAKDGMLCVINRRRVNHNKCPNAANAKMHKKLTNRLYRSYNRTLRRLLVKDASPMPKFRHR